MDQRGLSASMPASLKPLLGCRGKTYGETGQAASVVENCRTAYQNPARDISTNGSGQFKLKPDAVSVQSTVVCKNADQLSAALGRHGASFFSKLQDLISWIRIAVCLAISR